MTMDAKLLAELKALEAKATQPPWGWTAMDSHMLGLGQVPPGPSAEELTDPGGVMICGCSRCDACVKRGAKCFCPSDSDQLLIAAMRNALPALLAAAEEAERIRALFDARGEVCTAVRAGIAAMQNGSYRDSAVAEAETYAALNRLIALEKAAALSPAPAASSSHNPAPNVSGDGGSDSKVSGLMLPDLWTVVDGEGTRVGGVKESDIYAIHMLQQIEGTPGSIHGPYRVVKIPGHMATIEAKADGGGDDEKPISDPQPIGKCDRCGTPVYTVEGFCGVCRGGGA